MSVLVIRTSSSTVCHASPRGAPDVALAELLADITEAARTIGTLLQTADR